MKRTIAVLSLCLACCLGVGVIRAASGPNYATTQEVWNLYYDGYAQIQPSYWDSTAPYSTGGYARRGGFRYLNSADDRWFYTETSDNKHDSRILSVSQRVRDSLNPFAPKTIFKTNFDFNRAAKVPVEPWAVNSEATE